MQKPWSTILIIVATVGCLGLAALVGYMVATSPLSSSGTSGTTTGTSTAGKTPSTTGTSTSTAPTGGREMSPAAIRAANPSGAWNNDLTMLSSTDGVTFTSPKTVVENGGVPSMTKGTDGTLYLVFQWFPTDDDDSFDKIATKKSTDNGKTWSDPELIVIDGFPAEYARPYDPTIAVGSDGKLHLFFTTGATRMQDIAYITSAVGTDGVNFTWEPGSRLDVTDEPNYDCAAAELNGTWYLMTPRWPEASGTGIINEFYTTSSEDGITFKKGTQMTGASTDMNWTGNLLVEDDTLWFYGSGKNGMWRASSTDGNTWSAKSSLTMAQGGADPAIIKTDAGTYLIVSVTMPTSTQTQR